MMLSNIIYINTVAIWAVKQRQSESTTAEITQKLQNTAAKLYYTMTFPVYVQYTHTQKQAPVDVMCLSIFPHALHLW